LFNGLLEALSELVKYIFDQGGPAYKDLKVASGADWIRPCGPAVRTLIYHYETERDISFYVGALAGRIQRNVITRVDEKLPPIGEMDSKWLVCVLVLGNWFTSCHLCVCFMEM